MFDFIEYFNDYIKFIFNNKTVIFFILDRIFYAKLILWRIDL